MAVQSPKRIVFVVKILKDNPDSEPVKVVSEESIIREPVQVTSTENGHKTDKQDEDTERGEYIEGLECAEGVEIQKL